MTTYDQTDDGAAGFTAGSTTGAMAVSARPFSLSLGAVEAFGGSLYGQPANIDFSTGALAGILGKNQIAPVISNVSPAAGTITRTTSVALRITDDESELQKVVVLADFSSGETETIYDGSTFQPGYSSGSSATPVTGGFDYVFAADLGWWNSFTLRTMAVDNDGNIATSNAALAYTVSNPGSAVVPALSNVSPANSSTITRTASVSFDVTHALGHLGLATVWAIHADGRKELVHDGSGFSTPYTGSSRSSISNGYTFTIVRAATWPTATVGFVVAADDTLQGVTSLALSYTVSNPGDAVNASLSNLTPADASTIDVADTTSFDVTHALGRLGRVVVLASYTDGASEVVHDGSAFSASFSGSSTRSSISNGYTFTLERADGWPQDDADFVIIASDTNGGDDVLGFGYTIDGAPPPPDVTSPVLSNLTPTSPSEISRTTPVSFDLTDDGTFRRVMVMMRFADSYEVVHDGDAFGPQYDRLSTRVAISGGYRFRVRRNAGWASAPTVRVFGFDTGGNEL